MVKTITQKITFRNTKPAVLYNLYMNSKKHSESTGASAKIGAKEGASYSAYDGYAAGKNLRLIKDSLIIQTWRASDWEDSDVDSVFVLTFEQKGKDTILTMVHANVPAAQAESLGKGWHDYYWKPWKKYLASE